MARTLTSGQQTALEANPYRLEKLLEVQTPAGSYYYTTGQFNVDASTDTSGGTQTYLRANGVELFGDIVENYDLGINELQINIGDVSDTVYDNITRTSNDFDFQRTAVNVYWLFRDVSTGVPDTSNIITLFKGVITKLDSLRTDDDFILIVRAANKFSNFDLVNGRRTSDFIQGQNTYAVYLGGVQIA